MAEVKHIVRVANTDLDGHKAVGIALKKIKGIGYTFSNMVCRLANIDNSKKAGLLESAEIDRLNSVIADPLGNGAPVWIVNRKRDIQTDTDRHLIGGDLEFTHEQDIRRLKKIRSYRGFRHAGGLPSRGQRTKSNFRRNKGKAIGVKKKSGAKAGRV